ncbi:hypothetical protein C8J56DRAFT_1025935 [Mycena floridula]|nr:hypothetical protein C8J56DRAFT_1025935 [Mycena floridula]
MPLNVFHSLNNFDSSNMLKDREGFPAWFQELEMVFAPQEELWKFMTNPSQTRPSDSQATALAKYNTFNTNGRTAIYKTISSPKLRKEFVKKDLPAYTILDNMKKELDRNSRSSRHGLLHRIFNPVHDPSKDISEHYVADMVEAVDDFVKLGYELNDALIIDSLVMHLHPSWDMTHQMLVALPVDPTLTELRHLLAEAQKTDKMKEMLGQDNVEVEKGDSALAAGFEKKKRSSGRHHRRSHSRSKSFSDSEAPRRKYRWLEPEGPSDCTRCGLSGHPARFCMAVMPQQRRDKAFQIVQISSRPDNPTY